jgi:hypothetical protein
MSVIPVQNGPRDSRRIDMSERQGLVKITGAITGGVGSHPPKNIARVETVRTARGDEATLVTVDYGNYGYTIEVLESESEVNRRIEEALTSPETPDQGLE